MKKNKEITPINVHCERLSVYNKQLKASGHETAKVYIDTKLAKPIECENNVQVTIYGNTIEQIVKNIGSTEYNWSTHVMIATKELSSKEKIRICWEKSGVEYNFLCELMHADTNGQGKSRYFDARYYATAMYTLDSDGNIHYLVKNGSR